MRHSVRCLAFLMACGLLTFCAEGATYKVIVLDEGEEVAYGLGVWVADGVLLTSAAIVKQGDQVFIEDPGTGVRYVAEVMSSSFSMSLLSVSGFSVSDSLIVTIASKSPEKESSVYISLPDSVKEIRRKGLLYAQTEEDSLLNPRYLFTMTVDSSEFGAPIMNRCEELITVVSGQKSSNETATSESYPTLISYLKQNVIDFAPSSAPCLSEEEVISQLEDSSKALQDTLESLGGRIDSLQDSIKTDRTLSAEQIAILEEEKSALEEERKDAESKIVRQDSLSEVARRESASREAILDSLVKANTIIGEQLFFIKWGAAFVILIALILLFLFWKRRRDTERELTDKDNRLQEAEEELEKKSATFPDILLSGFGLGNEEIRIKISGEKLAQNDEGVILGRSSQHADCVIVENSVSRRHASVRLIENKVVICDLKSLNGTIVNGLNLVAGENYALEHGSKIILGDVSLEMTILQ